MQHHRRWTLLLAALAFAVGCGHTCPPPRPAPVPAKVECWTIEDDKEIPIPPTDGASEAEEVDFEVRTWSTFWRLRCACGARRPDWCNYDGSVARPR